MNSKQNKSKFDFPPELTAPFSRVSKTGHLEEFTALVKDFYAVENEQRQLERTLTQIKTPDGFAAFVGRCRVWRKDFATEVAKERERLLDSRNSLAKRRSEILQRLGELDLTSVDLLNRSTKEMRGSNHRKKVTPSLAARNAVIDANMGLSALEICKKLDLQFGPDIVSAEYLPARWTRDCGARNFVTAYRKCPKRVRKLISARISVAKKLGVTPMPR